jgi:hypothetical protein
MLTQMRQRSREKVNAMVEKQLGRRFDVNAFSNIQAVAGSAGEPETDGEELFCMFSEGRSEPAKIGSSPARLAGTGVLRPLLMFMGSQSTAQSSRVGAVT